MNRFSIDGFSEIESPRTSGDYTADASKKEKVDAEGQRNIPNASPEIKREASKTDAFVNAKAKISDPTKAAEGSPSRPLNQRNPTMVRRESIPELKSYDWSTAKPVAPSTPPKDFKMGSRGAKAQAPSPNAATASTPIAPPGPLVEERKGKRMAGKFDGVSEEAINKEIEGQLQSARRSTTFISANQSLRPPPPSSSPQPVPAARANRSGKSGNDTDAASSIPMSSSPKAGSFFGGLGKTKAAIGSLFKPRGAPETGPATPAEKLTDLYKTIKDLNKNLPPEVRGQKSDAILNKLRPLLCELATEQSNKGISSEKLAELTSCAHWIVQNNESVKNELARILCKCDLNALNSAKDTEGLERVETTYTFMQNNIALVKELHEAYQAYEKAVDTHMATGKADSLSKNPMVQAAQQKFTELATQLFGKLQDYEMSEKIKSVAAGFLETDEFGVKLNQDESFRNLSRQLLLDVTEVLGSGDTPREKIVKIGNLGNEFNIQLQKKSDKIVAQDDIIPMLETAALIHPDLSAKLLRLFDFDPYQHFIGEGPEGWSVNFMAFKFMLEEKLK